MSQHVVIIGAVALGPKAASRFKRIEPESTVTMIDKSEIIAYGGCGIPYYVSGEVSEAMQLRTSSFHMVRDETFFRETKDVNTITGVEATHIDREAKEVRIKKMATGEEDVLRYDKLVIATGARPRTLPIPGADLNGVHVVSNPEQAESIRTSLTKGEVERAVIVGAGFIGLEMADAFADMWDVDTTVVEIAPQIMPRFMSPELAQMARQHMEEKGVSFLLNEKIQRIEGEDGRVQRVVTDKRTLEADVVIVSVGVIPNDELAKSCGLKVHERGGIIVDECMRTSDPDIFAGGDCVVIKNLITGGDFFLPLGSMANRQGRIIGTNLAGGDARSEGAVGTFVAKIFERSIAGSGLSLSVARDAGFDADSVLLTSLDRAHFYPTKELMTLELVYEKPTRRILGIQGFGTAGDTMVGRVNVVAGLLPRKPTIDELSNLEMAYSPPFSSAMDVLNFLGNMADNVLEGRNLGVGPEIFCGMWEKRQNGEYFFLDCREEANARPFLERHPDVWHNIPQGKVLENIDKFPKDKTIVLLCNTGSRSYEAQIMLRKHGITDVVNIYGGMVALKQWGIVL